MEKRSFGVSDIKDLGGDVCLLGELLSLPLAPNHPLFPSLTRSLNLPDIRFLPSSVSTPKGGVELSVRRPPRYHNDFFYHERLVNKLLKV